METCDDYGKHDTNHWKHVWPSELRLHTFNSVSYGDVVISRLTCQSAEKEKQTREQRNLRHRTDHAVVEHMV